MAHRASETDHEVAIAVPHTGSVSTRWAVRLATMDLPPHVIVTKSTGALDLAREYTVEDALANDPEWVLFLDSDVIPPVDVFYQLRRHDRDVVSGVYYVDGEVVHPAIWLLDEDDSLSPLVVDEDDAAGLVDEQGLVEADAVGLGCTLVRRSVFEDLERPWFRWTKGYEDHPWDLQHQGERPGISEDFWFCHRLQEAGYQIHVDTAVTCVHETTCYLTEEGVFLQAHLTPD